MQSRNVITSRSPGPFATWLERHPTVEVSSRDRGTTFADGAARGAPQALQIADRWHLIHTLGEALEQVLARHHADLKRAFTREEEQQAIQSVEPEALVPARVPSQSEQVQIARQERRMAIFTQVHDLYATSAGVVLPLPVSSASIRRRP